MVKDGGARRLGAGAGGGYQRDQRLEGVRDGEAFADGRVDEVVELR